MEMELAPDGRDCCIACAYGVCLAGGEGGRQVAWGVILGYGFCAVVGVYGVRGVVMFLLKVLGGGVYSVKKLVKLVFLAQCDVEGVSSMSIGTAAATRADFYIWSYGPMSNEVYDALESEDFDLVRGELGLEIRYVGPASRPVTARLSDVAAAGNPGNWSGM